ncbi:MAG: hypothetical protein LUH51_03725 [Firmicutes bacterium]|nr:hypothetical protein [Bacillota bacterium]
MKPVLVGREELQHEHLRLKLGEATQALRTVPAEGERELLGQPQNQEIEKCAKCPPAAGRFAHFSGDKTDRLPNFAGLLGNILLNFSEHGRIVAAQRANGFPFAPQTRLENGKYT